MTTPALDAVVLAAGGSTRLGEPKQSVSLHGVTLLERTVDIALGAADGNVHVILGAHADRFQPLLENRDVCPHIFDNWTAGQNASLSFALSKITPGRAVAVLVVDQYRLLGTDISRLVTAWRAASHRPAAASYASTLGVPVVWPANYIERLRVAPRGQALLDPDACTQVPLAAAAYDLDTPDDLRALREFERG